MGWCFVFWVFFLLLCSCVTSVLLGIMLPHPRESSTFHSSDLPRLLFIVEFRNLHLILRYSLFSQQLFHFSKLNGFNVNEQQIKTGQRTETFNFLVV